MSAKHVKVEVLPAVRARVGEALEELVTRKVQEVLSQKESVPFQPWFADKATAAELRRKLSIPERIRWGRYYQKWGCVRCGTKRRAHNGCGFCAKCYAAVRNRIRTVERELLRERDFTTGG